MPNTFYNLFRYHRQNSNKAIRALELARVDMAEKKTRYPKYAGNGIGARSSDGLQWIERPQDIGLRFVGFSDDLAGRAVGHTGWYTRDECFDSVYRGAVYQFPARDGSPVYVTGYRAGSNSRKRGWSDECGTESARLELCSPIYGGTGGRESNDDGIRDAAMLADEHARVAAEHEREYQEAWQAGADYAQLAEDIADARREFLELRAEIKSAPRPANETPSICATLRAQCESLVQTIRDARDKRDKLRDGYYSADMKAAFNDGASESVFA